MTMKSTNLLPALREIHQQESRQRISFRESITALLSTDRAMFAAEFASAASFGMWYIFDDVNVDDVLREKLIQAHERAFPGEDRTVWEHHQDALNDPGTYDNGFMSPLKGVVAEINAKEELNQRGWAVDLAPDASQQGWDLSGTDPSGNYTQIQVKTGESYDAGDIQGHMDNYPVSDVNYADHYAIGKEIHEKYTESGMDAGGRTLTDIGPDYELVGKTTDDLQALSNNLGIDAPDSAADILPYAGAIIAGARLIYGVVKTEREFKAVDRTKRNKMQVVQALTLMSRMGINTVLTTAFGSGGGAAGTAVAPGPGTAVGIFVGVVGAVRMGMYLNKHLTGPLMMDLALDITGLTRDDLFYYKNKGRVDRIALSYYTRSEAVQGAV